MCKMCEVESDKYVKKLKKDKAQLLEALKGLVNTCDSFARNVDCKKAKAAIEAAENGEG